MKPKIPKKYQPRGFEVLFEDRDLIVGNKAAGHLTVAALWNKDQTVHSAVQLYVQKGNPKNPNRALVVHRLDQDTTGVLVFAKSERVQDFLKDNWSTTVKTYYAIVHGKPKEPKGTITSYLEEDDDYVVHSSKQEGKGKLAITEYELVAVNGDFSLLKINLKTGRKNQIRVHLAGEKMPVVGDVKYGRWGKYPGMALHSASLEFTHPHNKKRILVEAPMPRWFEQLVPFAPDAIKPEVRQ